MPKLDVAKARSDFKYEETTSWRAAQGAAIFQSDSTLRQHHYAHPASRRADPGDSNTIDLNHTFAPEQPTTHHPPRTEPESYDELIPRFREVVRNAVSPGATVLVVSKGDNKLLELSGVTAWHFPRREDGVYAGHYPADSKAAIAHLETLRIKGRSFWSFPSRRFGGWIITKP